MKKLTTNIIKREDRMHKIGNVCRVALPGILGLALFACLTGLIQPREAEAQQARLQPGEPKPNSETISKPTAAAFVSSADIESTLKQAPEMDQPIRVVDAGRNNVGIYIVRRLQEADQGCTIEHDTLALDDVTEVIRVIEGSGTLVTGGTLSNRKQMPADDPDLTVLGPGARGSSIQGGESRRISAGDEIVIPAGVPHGFSEIQTKSITLQVIRIDSGKVLHSK
jgi:mannose-6-phosphate isomerase-like protein (cupin superfamily)